MVVLGAFHSSYAQNEEKIEATHGPSVVCNQHKCVEVKKLPPATTIENVARKGNSFYPQPVIKLKEPAKSAYKYKDENGQTVYSDEKPEKTNSKELNLQSPEMRNKISVIETSKSWKKASQTVDLKLQQDEIRQQKIAKLHQELAQAKTQFAQLDATLDEDWTFVGRRRVLSPSYENKSRLLTEKIVQIEREISKL